MRKQTSEVKGVAWDIGRAYKPFTCTVAPISYVNFNSLSISIQSLNSYLSFVVEQKSALVVVTRQDWSGFKWKWIN